MRAIGHCPTALHPALNCSARLVLNLNREAMAATGFSPPTRVFEAAACGACLVSDAWEGVDRFFAPGEEVLLAGGPEDLARYVRDGGPGRGPGDRGAGPPPGPARPQLRHPRRHLRARRPGRRSEEARSGAPGGYIGGLPIRAIRAIVPARG